MNAHAQDAVTGVVLDAAFLLDMVAAFRVEHEVLTDRWSRQAVTVNVPQTELVLVERRRPGQARVALGSLHARCGPSVMVRALDLAAVGALGEAMRRHRLTDLALAHTVALAAPPGWTVYTAAAERYLRLGDVVDVFSLA
ncbi:hypothetical protein [Streptomyces hoynatensis]|uniref:PIN domain-containing protein n=1 Tax=Streptomyces hoynatensis TaxID=1141874 RepID=A0A3A9YM41_9ACTN|nr:hypothetical protein [Streptomyces hoynatensis]RKN37395.1 hypothetical protein D7294_28065 [Streptomyces hoynatensis]